MSIIEISPLIDQRRRVKDSKYQSPNYLCLDVVTYENWIHRWRCVEVVKKNSNGEFTVWQFKFDHNKLQFQHYHKAVRATRLDVPAKLLWRGFEVVEQYPEGHEGTSHIDLAVLSVPSDVTIEARKKFLSQLDENMQVITPE